jgi:CBS domain-containing protein
MIKYYDICVYDMSLDSLMVSSIMTHDVKTEKEDQNIMAACKVMNDNNIGCVIIVKIQNKEKLPVGIITERDILRILGKLTLDLQKPLTSFMSKPIITIQSNASTVTPNIFARTIAKIWVRNFVSKQQKNS